MDCCIEVEACYYCTQVEACYYCTEGGNWEDIGFDCCTFGCLKAEYYFER